MSFVILVFYEIDCFIHCSAKRWAVNVRRDDLVNKSAEYMNKNCCLCSEHFEHIMFLNDLRNRLQPTAVPTLVNVSNPPALSAVERPAPKCRNVGSDATAKKRKTTAINTNVQGIIVCFSSMRH